MKTIVSLLAIVLAALGFSSCKQDTITNTISKEVFPYRSVDSVVVYATGVPAPVSLAIDASNNIYAADPNTGNINRIRPDRTIDLFATTGTNVGAIALSPSGDLYASCYGDGTLKKVGPAGGTMTTVMSGIDNPSGIAFDNSGNVFVGSHNGNVIYRISSTGSQTVFTSILRPSGMLFDTQGNLIVGDQRGHTVRSISPSGAVSFFAHGIPSPHTLRWDSKGNLFISESATDSKTVTVIASTGFVYQLSDDFNWPTGMVFDQSGNLYVANYAGGSISKVFLTP
jgi:sugar lactone lactonase YvrE